MSTMPPIRRDRLPGRGRADDRRRGRGHDHPAAARAGPAGPGHLLATTDDTSVARGFFAVTVRAWQVMMQAEPHASQP